MVDTKLLDAALRYAEEGFSVIPVTPNEKAPPLVDWQVYQEEAASAAQIREWWGRTPHANIAIITGQISGLTVLDFDGDKGRVSFRDRLEHDLPPTRVHRTPRGAHLLFQYHPDLKQTAHLLPGVDVRSDGGYIIAPPSVVKGNTYQLFQARDLAVINTLPPSLNHKKPTEARTADLNDAPNWVSTALSGVPIEQRNNTAARLIGYFHHKGLPPDIVESLMLPFAERCTPPMDAAELRRTIASVTRYEVDSSATGGVPDERIITFHTAAEIRREGIAEVQWVVRNWVASGSITEVVGKIKLAGKTTFLLNMSRAVSDGVPFLGEETSKRPVVYLTEQPRSSFMSALRRADLQDREDFIVLFWNEVLGIPWVGVAEEAVAKAIGLDALLVIDTLPQFASIRGDGENSAGEALEAMRPLQRAAADGLGMIAVRHERKSGGEIGESGRGSSAFGGAVDTLITIRRGDGNTQANVRLIEAISRFDDVPPQLYIRLGPEGYEVLGTEGDIARQMARAYLLDKAPASEGDAAKVDELAKDAGIGQTTLRDVVAELLSEGVLHRTGAGKKNDAYRYWRPKIPSSAYRQEVAEESISDTKSDPSEPGSPGMMEGEVGESTSDPSAAPKIHSSATPTLYTEERNERPEQPELPIVAADVMRFE